MGFLKNAADEFGKKTGKALGNKLYGRHADDIRIGMGGLDGGGEKKTTRHDVEIAEIESETRELELDQKTREIELAAELEEKSQFRDISNEIAAITFSTTNIEENFAKLDAILPYAKMESRKDKAKEQLVDIAQTKFQTGLALCRRINPDHPMLEIYEEQKLSKKKKSIFDDEEDTQPKVLTAAKIREINKVEFSSTDIDSNIKILNNLLVYFDIDPEECNEKEAMAVNAAHSKFKSGLAMCKVISPNNPMIAFLENEMKEKVDKLTQKKKKSNRETVILIAALLLIPVVLYLFFMLLGID